MKMTAMTMLRKAPPMLNWPRASMKFKEDTNTLIHLPDAFVS